MDKVATNTVDAQAKAEEPKVVKLLDISVDEQKRIYVNWPQDKKELCVVALAEAIKLVETYEPPKIITPNGPGFIPGIRDFLTGRKTR